MTGLYGELHALGTAPRDLQIAPRAGFAFARHVTEVPIHGFELTEMVAALPLALQPGDWEQPMVGFTGHRAGTNVCVGPKDGWPGVATPAALTTYPFMAGASPDESDKGRIFADFASDLLVTAEGLALFDDDGRPTATLIGYRDAAIEQYRDRVRVARAVAALAEAGVLAPFEANDDVETVDPERHFYVRTAALASVDDATFIHLRRAGALPIAFGQAHSLVNMRKLRRMDQVQQRQHRARRGAKTGEPAFAPEDEDVVLDFG